MNDDFRHEFPSMQEAFPAATDALSGSLAELEDLPALDNKTKELVRLACTTALRHGPGVRRHAMLAAEFGASWEEVLRINPDAKTSSGESIADFLKHIKELVEQPE